MRVQPSLSFPKRLVYTACRLAVAGTLACACGSDGTPGADAAGADADARSDAIVDASLPGDANGDACMATLLCRAAVGTDAASCPGLICDPADCPPGCELLG